MVMIGGEEFKDSDRLMDSCWCIAMDTSGSAYSWEVCEDGDSRLWKNI